MDGGRKNKASHTTLGSSTVPNSHILFYFTMTHRTGTVRYIVYQKHIGWHVISKIKKHLFSIFHIELKSEKTQNKSDHNVTNEGTPQNIFPSTKFYIAYTLKSGVEMWNSSPVRDVGNGGLICKIFQKKGHQYRQQYSPVGGQRSHKRWVIPYTGIRVMVVWGLYQ